MEAKPVILEEIPYHELKQAYKRLEEKNKGFVEGLYYAAFVQQGLMPQPRHFEKLNQACFVLYQPLQIIGGDFFWIGKKDGWCIYAVGDCTGHGVSGAMLSALAIGFLNYVVYSKSFPQIGDILQEIDKKWIETFQHGEDCDVNNDWMELSVVAYSASSGEVQFSGAGSSMLVVSEGSIQQFRGASYPVGGWQIEKDRSFETLRFYAAKDTRLFLFSDGFKDQFGGVSGKRLGMKNFRQLLLSSSHLGAVAQKNALETVLALWKAGAEQTDDICLLRIDL